MEIVRTTRADSDMILETRKLMFEEMGKQDLETIWLSIPPFRDWLLAHIANKTYIGVFAVEDDTVLSAAGMYIMDFPPGPLTFHDKSAYLLNVYTFPEYRGRGLAKQLVQYLIDEAQKRGIRRILLHASDAGRPLYEAMGFTITNEMRLLLD
jgi:ribosomal protein S18 acetylase RimI-like enzyme